MSRSCRTWGGRLLSLGIGGCRHTLLRDSPVGTQAQSHPAGACWHSFWLSLHSWCFLWEWPEISHEQIQKNHIGTKHCKFMLPFRNCSLGILLIHSTSCVSLSKYRFVCLAVHSPIHLSNCYVPSTVWEPSGEHLVGAVSILSLSVLWPSLLFLSPTFSLSHPFNFRFLPRGGIPLVWIRPRKTVLWSSSSSAIPKILSVLGKEGRNLWGLLFSIYLEYKE